MDGYQVFERVMLAFCIIALVCIFLGIIISVASASSDKGTRSGAGCIFGIIGIISLVIAFVLIIINLFIEPKEPYTATDNYTGSPQYYQDAYEYYKKHPDELR